MTTLPDHLTVETSDRGFARMPTIPSTYGGHVAAYESSGASNSYLWVKVRDENVRDGEPVESHAHLLVEDALRLADQLVRLVADHYQYSNSVDTAPPLGAAAGQITEQIAALKANPSVPGLSRRDIQAITRLSPAGTHKMLSRLQEQGTIVRPRRGHYRLADTAPVEGGR